MYFSNLAFNDQTIREKAAAMTMDEDQMNQLIEIKPEIKDEMSTLHGNPGGAGRGKSQFVEFIVTVEESG